MLTEAVCRPSELGIDVVLESATKYLNGHADLAAGVVAGSEAFLKTVGIMCLLMRFYLLICLTQRKVCSRL